MKMKIKVRTSKVGSEVSKIVEIPDEDMVGMSKYEKESYLTDYARDELNSLMEWGWEEVE